MPDDPRQGLFFPGQQAATAAAGAGTGTSDPVAAAAAEAVKRHGGRRFDRRLALRWAGWGSILAVVGGWMNGFLGFFHPNKTGAFGGTITAGAPEDFKVGDVKAF